MSPYELSTGIIFFSQTGFGILGNLSLLSCYVFLSCTGKGLKDIDFVLNNLILANCLVLLSKGIPQIIVSFRMKNFLGDFGCKLVFYLHRVASGATCILSCFQAIKISLSRPRWIKAKATPVKYTRVSIILSWTLHMLVDSIILNYVTGPRESNNHTETQDLGYCSSIISGRFLSTLYSAIFSCIDILPLWCIFCASVFMVFILYKHKQNNLYIQRKICPPKSFAETRATQSILLLAGIYFCSYSLSSLFAFFMSPFKKPSGWIVDTSSLTAASFPCLSPFVLISRDPLVSGLCSTAVRRFTLSFNCLECSKCLIVCLLRLSFYKFMLSFYIF